MDLYSQWSTNWPHIKERVGALSQKWDGCLHQILQLRAQGSLWNRRKKKSVRALREGMMYTKETATKPSK